MLRGLRLAHFIGLAMFLGSILTFVIISNLTVWLISQNLFRHRTRQKSQKSESNILRWHDHYCFPKLPTLQPPG
jgi:hypothetical protein